MSNCPKFEKIVLPNPENKENLSKCKYWTTKFKIHGFPHNSQKFWMMFCMQILNWKLNYFTTHAKSNPMVQYINLTTMYIKGLQCGDMSSTLYNKIRVEKQDLLKVGTP